MKTSLLATCLLTIALGPFARAAVEPHKIGFPVACREAFPRIFDANSIRLQLAENHPKCRYMKSERWGWIDFRHFGASARMVERQGYVALTDIAVVVALMAGETHEQIAEADSRYSVEDLPSNFLGASFQSMYARGFFGSRSYSGALLRFLSSLKMSERAELSKRDRWIIENEVKNESYSPVENSKSSWAVTNLVSLELNRLRLMAIVSVSPTRPLRGLLLNLPVVHEEVDRIDRRSK